MRASFAIETTLSGRLHLQDVTRARSDGWEVGLLYIGLSSPRLAIERIRQRVLAGGHDIPAGDIRRRYGRSLINLGIIGAIADALFVFDNSSQALKMLLVANRAKIAFKSPALPAWARRSLGAVIQSSEKGPR